MLESRHFFEVKVEIEILNRYVKEGFIIMESKFSNFFYGEVRNMGKWKFYLLLPMLAVLAFGSVSFAQEIDKDALKAELRAELKAELKQELMAELKSETKASVQEATLGLRDVMRSDFSDEIRAEIMQEDIAGAVEEALAGSAIMGGLFSGTEVSGFIDTNFIYNLRNHGEGYGDGGNRGANARVNFVGENEDNTFAVESFTMFMDKGATDEHPVGWQMHTYWGEKAQGITFFGFGDDATAASSSSNVAGWNDRFAIATANVTWNAPFAGKTVPITMGKMYTWIGYELVENIGNPNYTHGMVYNNVIPFTHTGISFDVSEFINSDAWGLTLYAVNGWDTYIDNNEGKSFGAYLTYAPNDDFFISLAGIYGPETAMMTGANAAIAGNTGFGGDNESDNVGMYDIVITYSLPQVDNLSLGANWDHGKADDNSAGHPTGSQRSDAHWWAAVGYAMYDFSDNQMGALRYEYFDDTDGAKAFDISMWSLTYTHNITIADNLMLRPEIRHNSYSDNTSTTTGTIGSLTPGDKGHTADDETILAFGVEYIF